MSEVQVIPARLVACETVISRALSTFVDIGRALTEIRDGRLYKKNGYKSFESYCRERWGFQRDYSDRLIGAARVVDVVTPIGGTLPATESQARPLTKLPPKKQISAWTEVVGTAPEGRVTARHVEAIVRKMLPEETVLDSGRRRKTPDNTVCVSYGRYRELLSDLRLFLKDIHKQPEGAFLDARSIRALLRSVSKYFDKARPVGKCPKCQRGCVYCRHSGLVPESLRGG